MWDLVAPDSPREANSESLGCWFFGYGSLIWRPAFRFVESRPAFIRGFRRRFWQASTDHRGTETTPGRVVTLEPAPGGVCWGVAFRVAPSQLKATFANLDQRESGGYERLMVELGFKGSDCVAPARSRAWVYVATRENPNFTGPTPLPEVARIVTRAHGPSGPNAEYVLRLADALRKLGIESDDAISLAELLRRPDSETW